MLKFARILLIAFLLAGCTEPVTPDPDPKPEPNKEELFKDPQGKNISSPVNIPFVYGNPLELLYSGDSRVSSVQISGLKNKVIENKINKEINEMIDTLLSYKNAANLPPYRGIYARIPSESTALDYNIYSYVSYNFNNVLSITFTGWYNFNIGGTAEYVTASDALNYDLTTGNHLTVSDLLTNDVNTKQALSDPLSVLIKKSMDSTDSFGWDRYPLDLVSPFRGIKGNQVFYITNSGIVFIFDYRNPEFNSRFQTIQLNLRFKELLPYLAITERFRTDKDIYEAPIRHAEFLELSSGFHHGETKTIKYKNVDVYFSEHIPDDVPSYHVEQIPDVLPILYKMIDEYVDSVDIQSASGSIFASVVGEYVNIGWYASIYFDEIYHKEWSASYNGKGEIMKLADLFVDGYMYKDVIWSSLLETYPGYSFIDKTIILDSITFSIHTTGLNFFVNIPATETTSSESFSFYVPYGTFGMDNLTLFQHE
jgi:hypothetical protein